MLSNDDNIGGVVGNSCIKKMERSSSAKTWDRLPKSGIFDGKSHKMISDSALRKLIGIAMVAFSWKAWLILDRFVSLESS